MTETYKDFNIRYSEARDAWTILDSDDDNVGERPLLKEAKKFIDKYKADSEHNSRCMDRYNQARGWGATKQDARKNLPVAMATGTVVNLNREKFKRVSVYATDGYDDECGLEKGTLTSVLPNGQYRVSLEGRGWVKTDRPPVLDTPENRIKIRAIAVRKHQIEILEKKITATAKTFVRYTKPGK